MQTEIRALTLHRPWPWAIFHAGKNYENRRYKLPCKFIDVWVAIHAGLRYDNFAKIFIEENACVVVPVEPMMSNGIIGVVKFGESVTATQSLVSAWATGPHAWPIVDRICFKKEIYCKGKQGFWTPDEDAQARMHNEIEMVAA